MPLLAFQWHLLQKCAQLLKQAQWQCGFHQRSRKEITHEQALHLGEQSYSPVPDGRVKLPSFLQLPLLCLKSTVRVGYRWMQLKRRSFQTTGGIFWRYSQGRLLHKYLHTQLAMPQQCLWDCRAPCKNLGGGGSLPTPPQLCSAPKPSRESWLGYPPIPN